MSTATDPTVVDIPLSDVAPYDDTDGGPDHRAHLVRPADNGHPDGGPDGMRGQDVVDLARVTGTEVVAACGHRFVPKRDPKRYPPCDPCLDAAADMIAGRRP